MIHYISNEVLILENIEALLVNDAKLKLSEEAIINIQKCNSFLNEQISDQSLEKKLTENKHNLLQSYACSIGEPVPDVIVKLMLFLKIQSLCYGFSGIRLEIVERLLDFYNNNVLPVVYSKDTPDDRIALAHLALPIIGKGEVRIKGKIFSACELEEKFGWQPLSLRADESEVLLGGTQLTTAYGVYNLIKSSKISNIADFISVISVQIFGANTSSFSEQVQMVRPHKGQIQTAQQMRMLLENHRILDQTKKISLSAPEAFCAIPQVHGAVKDTIAYVRKIVKTEVNSTTDNLLIFPNLKQIISGGNSHTLPLSFGMDFLAIALTGLGNISERRIFYLISTLIAQNERESSMFLDLSVFQRITESILAENKRLSVPVSVESPIFTEKTTDIKGMGGSSAVKCSEVLKNIEQILAIELLIITLLISNYKIHFDSDIMKEYIDFLNFDTEQEHFKRNIEKTIQFFNETEHF